MSSIDKKVESLLFIIGFSRFQNIYEIVYKNMRYTLKFINDIYDFQRNAGGSIYYIEGTQNKNIIIRTLKDTFSNKLKKSKLEEILDGTLVIHSEVRDFIINIGFISDKDENEYTMLFKDKKYSLSFFLGTYKLGTFLNKKSSDISDIRTIQNTDNLDELISLMKEVFKTKIRQNKIENLLT